MPDKADQFNYHEAPAGTILTMMSEKGGKFIVRLEPGMHDAGKTRNVVVLEAPPAVRFTGTSEHPSYMVVCSPGTPRGKLLAHVHAVAKHTVDIGDEVHLVDTWAQLQSSKLRVASLTVS